MNPDATSTADAAPEPPAVEVENTQQSSQPYGVIPQQFTDPVKLEEADARQRIEMKKESVNEYADLANAPSLAVVKTLSVRGLEYLFMSICLWIGAVGLAWSLILLANGQANARMLAFPATSLIVCVPVFALFFIRLKRAELENPALRFDSSKRRLSQITQTVAFLASLFNVITFVYLVIASTAGTSSISIGKAVLNLIIILVVAGGILAYYWVDEHRSFNK